MEHKEEEEGEERKDEGEEQRENEQRPPKNYLHQSGPPQRREHVATQRNG